MARKKPSKGSNASTTHSSGTGSKDSKLKNQTTKAKPTPTERARKVAAKSIAPEEQSGRTQTHNIATNSFPIVGVGASAGGLEAFTELLKHLPVDTGMGFVLVQHLDPVHESALTKLLSRATSMPVRDVTNNLPVEPNQVYVIPPNTTLSIEKGFLKLKPRKQARPPIRSIDTFLESLANDQRERAIGVILSGTATDGTVGLEAVKAEGGITFAQDASAKYDSMPRNAVGAGCVDFVLSPAEIAKELARIATHPYVAGQAFALIPGEDHAAAAHEDDDTPLRSGGIGSPSTGVKRVREESEKTKEVSVARSSENDFKKILLLLRNHSGVDFSLYKSNTIQRRITRRVVLNKQASLGAYANFLRGNAKELDALYSDALISVTSFFRNPEAFEVLKHKVFAKLLQQRGDDPFRVWVVGCSTGQEAYSLAMAFTESADKAPRLRKLQVFATDLNDALLEKARHGLYAKTLAEDVSHERLRRFFVEEEGGYRIVKSLREMVVFARHNLITDPPFSRMDLISCRNLLIYLEPSLQTKAIPTFHYALKPHGFLFLGASESIGTFADLFEPIDKKQKIFSKKAATTTFHLPVRQDRVDRNPGQTMAAPSPVESQDATPHGLGGEFNAQREADRLTVNRFAPPGVLINADLQILQFRGPTSAYLQPPTTGKPSFDVLKMAREGLMLPLRATINRARRENKPTRRENVQLNQNGNTRTVNIEVVPLNNLRERCYLILFEEVRRSETDTPSQPSESKPGISGRHDTKLEIRRSEELERELSETRDYLQSILEQHETANEELQAANEEVQSANEELQSINEELETSKEELESTNEELITVNEEMANRNTELNRLNSDLVNLQTSTRLAIVLLGRDLTIRRFSVEAKKQFNLMASDVGRAISTVRHNLDLPDLENVISDVISSVREHEREVRDWDGRWYSLRVRPYITLDNRVDGAVLVLVDINALKQALEYAEGIIRTVPDPMVVLDAGLRLHTANDSFYQTFKVSPAEAEGRLIYDLGNRQWDIPKLRELLEDILSNNSSFKDFEVTHDFETIGRHTMRLNAQKLEGAASEAKRILLVIHDISERKHAEEEREQLLAREQQARGEADEANRVKDEFLAVVSHELRTPLTAIMGWSDMLLRGTLDETTATRGLEIIARNATSQNQLISDLLDVSRIITGRLRCDMLAVDLIPVINAALDSVRPSADAKGVALQVALDPAVGMVAGDAARLQQIVSNLLANSVKFTPRGGLVDVSLKREDINVAIIVSDTGEGISSEFLPHIFERFRQAEGTSTRQHGGLGLGLAIVQYLVEAQKGTVSAASEGFGKGATFKVTFPLIAISRDRSDVLRTSAGKSWADDISSSVLNGMRILVVDDIHDTRDLLTHALTQMGAEVKTSASAHEALEALTQWRPDILVSDIGMPGEDGYGLIRKLRERKPGDGGTIPAIALTGYASSEDAERARKAGFDAHIAKPVSPFNLATELARLVRKARPV